MKRRIKVAVSLLVMGSLLWWADAGAVLDHLQGASLGWLALAGASLTAITFLMAKRWQVTASALQIDIGYSHAVAEYYIAQWVNLVLPGGIVGDVARAVRARHAGDLTRAAQSVAAERIMGQIVMFVTLGIALIAALIVPGGIAWPAYTWVGIGLGIALAIMAVPVASGNSATGRFVATLFDLLKNLRLILLSVIITALLIFSLYACARATGTVIAPSGWLTLIPLVLSAMLIPLSVGGWGWREGAAAALFPLIGASPSAGIAMGIAYGAMIMIAALPGIFFAIRAAAAPAIASERQMEPL